MTADEAYKMVAVVLEARPGESLEHAMHRCIKERRSGRWAAIRLRHAMKKSEAEQLECIYKIAEKGPYR